MEHKKSPKPSAVPQVVHVSHTTKRNLESRRPAFRLYAYSVLVFSVSSRITWIKDDTWFFRFLKFKPKLTQEMMGSKLTITAQEVDHGVMIRISKNLLTQCSVSIRKATILDIIRKGEKKNIIIPEYESEYGLTGSTHLDN